MMKKTIMLLCLLGLCVICLFAQNKNNNIRVTLGYTTLWEKGMRQSMVQWAVSYKRNISPKYYTKIEFVKIGTGFGYVFPMPDDTNLWRGFIHARVYKNINLSLGYNIINSKKRHYLSISGGYSYRWGTEGMITDFIYWGNDINGKPVYEGFGLGQQVKQHGINFSIDYSFFLTRNKLLSIDNCLSTQVFWKGDPSLCFNTGLGVNF